LLSCVVVRTRPALALVRSRANKTCSCSRALARPALALVLLDSQELLKPW